MLSFQLFSLLTGRFYRAFCNKILHVCLIADCSLLDLTALSVLDFLLCNSTAHQDFGELIETKSSCLNILHHVTFWKETAMGNERGKIAP
jgi:hypothetical protein